MTVAHYLVLYFFFFNDTATTEIYTLSLHDALPICNPELVRRLNQRAIFPQQWHLKTTTVGGQLISASANVEAAQDRKSTRLNSSHANISYAVFCLKKKTHTSTAYTPLSV